MFIIRSLSRKAFGIFFLLSLLIGSPTMTVAASVQGYIKKGQFDQAETFCARQEGKDRVKSFRELGAAFMNRGRFEDAARCFGAASQVTDRRGRKLKDTTKARQELSACADSLFARGTFSVAAKYFLQLEQPERAVESLVNSGLSTGEAEVRVRIAPLARRVIGDLQALPNCQDGDFSHLERIVRLGHAYVKAQCYNEAILAFTIAEMEYHRVAQHLIGFALNQINSSDFSSAAVIRIRRLTEVVKVMNKVEFSSEIDDIKKFMDARITSSGLAFLMQLAAANDDHGLDDSSQAASAYMVTNAAFQRVHDPEFVQATLAYFNLRKVSSGAYSKQVAMRGLSKIKIDVGMDYILSHSNSYFFADVVRGLADKKQALLVHLEPGLSSENAFTRAHVAFAMGRVKAPEKRPVLLRFLEGETDPVVRLHLQYALVQQGEIALLDSLVSGLNRPVVSERIAAIRAIQWLAGEIEQQVSEAAILPLLDDANSVVRFYAVHVLSDRAETLGNSVIFQLVRHLDDEDEDVRGAIKGALMKVESDSLFGWLAKAARTGAVASRGAAIEILGERASSTYGELIFSLYQNDPSVRNSCVGFLGNLKTEAAREALVSHIRRDDALAFSAAIALLKFDADNPDRTKADLRQFKTTTSVFILAVMGEADGRDAIVRALAKGSIQERLQVANLAYYLGDADLVDTLQDLSRYHNRQYHPTDLYVRQAAWKALNKSLLAAQGQS